MPTSTELANQIEALFGGKVQPIQGVDRGFFPALKAGFLEETIGLGRPKTFEAETVSEHIGKFIGEVIPETAVLTGTIAALPIGGIAGGAASFAIVNTIQEAIRQARDEDEQSFAQELGEVAKSGLTGALFGGATVGVGQGLHAGVRAYKVAKAPIEKVGREALENLPLMDRLGVAIKQSIGKTKVSKVMVKRQLAKKLTKAGAISEKEFAQGNITKARNLRRAEMVGGLQKAELNVSKFFTKAEKNQIQNLAESNMRAAGEDVTIGIRLEDAVKKMLSNEVPQLNEIQLITRYLGEDVGKELFKKSLTVGAAAKELVWDVINLPRAMLASWDVSGALRQGIVLAPSNPRIWGAAVGRGVKSLFSGKHSAALNKKLATREFRTIHKKMDLKLTGEKLNPFEKGMREEPFISGMSSQVPGLRQSERSYTDLLNYLRVGKADDVIRKLKAKGINYKDSPEAYDRIGKFINYATGRGDLGKLGERFAPLLNATLFAPKLLMSRFQLMGLDAKAFAGRYAKDEGVRLVNRIIARDLASFVGAGIGFVSLASMGLTQLGKDATVETDPRSTDFAKIKVGDTRIDIWGGYQQLGRAITQLLLEERKATTTGRISDVNRLDVVTKFFQGKASPFVGMVLDFAKGEDFLGRKIPPVGGVLRLEPKAREEFSEQAFQRFVPLFLQDMVDALRFQGLTSAAITTPAFFGFGAQTYEPNSFTKSIRTKNLIANETFGKSWDELTPRQQIVLKRENESILKLEQAAKVERTGFFGLEASIERQLEIGKDVQVQLDKPIQTELKNLNVTIGGLSRSIGTGVPKGGKFFLNDERYARYQWLVKENINRILGSLIKRKQWAKVPTARKQEALKKVISRAKAISRKILVKEIETKK